jgi:hypothetical protein
MSGDLGSYIRLIPCSMKEQDMQTPQKGRVDVEEVRAQDRRGVPGQGRPPALPGPRPRGVVDAPVFDDLPMPENPGDCDTDGTLR